MVLWWLQENDPKVTFHQSWTPEGLTSQGYTQATTLPTSTIQPHTSASIDGGQVLTLDDMTSSDGLVHFVYVESSAGSQY